MRRLIVGGLLAAAVGSLTLVFAQPPGGGKKGPKGKGPPPYQMGKVLPPHILEELDLTREQLAQLAELEKDVKQRLEKLLTPEQKKRIESLRERGPKGGPKGKGKEDDDGPPRKGKGKDKGEGPGKDGRPERPPFDDGRAMATGGIQWFATLDRGLAEAKRTNRPILFLSAAPHCAGVSGIW
jgi:Spy/CpxP family protein refolding chaperone